MKHLRKTLFTLLCTISTLASAQDYLVITGNAVNIRTAPSPQAAKLQNQAYAGQAYIYLSTENGWHRFMHNDNQEAYISEKFGKKVTADPLPTDLFQGDYELKALYNDEIRFSTSLYLSRCPDGSLMLNTEAMRMSQEGNSLPAENTIYKGIIKDDKIYTSSGSYGFGDCDSDEWKELTDTDESPSKAAFWNNETHCFYFDNNVFEKQ